MANIEASGAISFSASGSVRSDATVVLITVQASTGDAPLPVFAHARFSGFQYQDIYTAYFKWDFGEPGSLHNTKEGAGLFNCAHVYETAGSYTITCTMIENDGAGNEVTDSATQVITVNAFNGTTYYVKNGGSDADTGLDDEHAWETFDFAITSIAGPDTRVLFNRGDTFTTAAGASIEAGADATYTQPIIIGAYGTGAKPIIQHTGTGATVTFDINANGVRVMDLAVVCTNATGAQCGLDSVNVDNGLFLRCDVSEFDVNIATGASDTVLNEGSFIFDCTSVDSYAIGVYIGGTYLAVVGCTFERSDASHILRVFNARSFYLADTDCRFPSYIAGTGRHALKLHNSASCPEGGSKVGQETEYGVIVDCEFEGGGYVVAIAPQSSGAEENPEYIRKIVFERNKIIAEDADAAQVSGTLLWVVAREIYIRNNLFCGDVGAAGAEWGTQNIIHVEDYSAVGTPVPQYVYVQGNSAYSGSSETGVQMYFVRLKTVAIDDVVVENNAVHFANSGTTWTALIMCTAGEMRDNITEQYNNLHVLPSAQNCWIREAGSDAMTLVIWQGLGKGTGSHDDRDPKFVSPTTYNFRLQTDSPCVDDGIYVSGLWNDYAGNRRALTGAVDMGALEWDSLIEGTGAISFSGSGTGEAVSGDPYSYLEGTAAIVFGAEGEGGTDIATAASAAGIISFAATATAKTTSIGWVRVADITGAFLNQRRPHLFPPAPQKLPPPKPTWPMQGRK